MKSKLSFLQRTAAAAVFAAVVFAGTAKAEDFLFTDAEADCAAEMIFMNECSGKSKNLLFWSPDEAFPSLGIGHFIWYPEKKAGPYQESFPAFLSFADEIGLPLPDWIDRLPGRHSPWRTRGEFLKDVDSDRARQLRAFLSATKKEQAQFIIRRFIRVFPTILDDLDEADRQSVREKYDLLMRSRAGTFAMVDYVNFKGEGFLTDARYDGRGWGLAQVLMEMNVPDDPDEALGEFIAAAERVLERRVRRSPRRDVEAKWLPGWKNRVRGYARVEC